MDRKEKLGKLMAAVSRYDRAAFAELMSLTRDKLTRTAYAYLRDGMLAEDCVNETYAALASHCLSVAPDRVEAWLRTVVVNKALNVLKKRRRELPLTEETAPPAAPEAEERAAVRSALERMPERERLPSLSIPASPFPSHAKNGTIGPARGLPRPHTKQGVFPL